MLKRTIFLALVAGISGQFFKFIPRDEPNLKLGSLLLMDRSEAEAVGE